MIFKLIFELADGNDLRHHECRVFSVENGGRLERRIDSAISNYKADGFKEARLVDCFNISEPDRNPWEHR